MTLEPGVRLGPYEVLAELGEGGMGEVYRAHDARLDRDVAIKVLPAAFAAEPDRLRRFEQEARAASALNHPNILVVHDVGTHDGAPFLVTELLEGQTLKERLRGRPLPAAEIVEVGLQLASALEAAHTRGIIHRDIKPANIFVTTRGPVKLLDFGLAKVAEAPPAAADAPTAVAEWATEAGVTLGTVGYMSPEQVRGEAVDARTDLFSLGVVLYEMASGMAPFRGATSGAVLGEILTQAPTSLLHLSPDAPPELERIVNTLLEKDRELRYQSAREIVADLMRLKRERESGRAATPGAAASRMPSLAVLPFTNMSADKENEYFCDGLSEELINALSHIRGLRVVARTSAFAFKGREIDVREVGKRLNVGAVLEGSVRKSVRRLRITAQLINVEDGFHIWSGQFDREMKDIFDIQEEISLTIVKHLKLTLLKDEKDKILRRYTEDLEAYDCYLKGRYFWYRRYEQGMQRSLQHFQQAIERDPGYALPHVGVADAFNFLGVFSFIPPHQAYLRAKAAAGKALEIDPEVAEAYASLGWISMWFDWDWPAAERHFLRAIQMKRDYAPAHVWYGNLLWCMGRSDESIREMQEALQLEPLEPVNPTHLGLALAMAGRFDESIEELRKVIASDPEFSLAYWYQSFSFLATGMWGEAIATLRRFVGLSAGSVIALSTLGFACGSAGMQDEALSILERLEGLSRERYVGSLWRATVWVGLGEKRRALDNLEEAYTERESQLACLKRWPIWDSLRSEPRFNALLEKMNLA